MHIILEKKHKTKEKNSWQYQISKDQIQHEYHFLCFKSCFQIQLIYMGNSCSDPSRIKIASLE